MHYATGTKDAVKELFLEVTKGGSKAESLELDFASQKLFSKWPEKRKTSAIRLLCDAPMLTLRETPVATVGRWVWRR